MVVLSAVVAGVVRVVLLVLVVVLPTSVAHIGGVVLVVFPVMVFRSGSSFGGRSFDLVCR